MKKLSSFSVFIFTILFSCSIIAQQPALLTDNSPKSSHVKKVIDYKRIYKIAFNQILAGLDSKIQGIVEGIIINVIFVKKYYPSADYSEMTDKLNKIGEENPDPSIRVKAHLASIYLSASDIINVKVKFHPYDYDYIYEPYDYDYIYKQITEQVENKILAHKW